MKLHFTQTHVRHIYKTKEGIQLSNILCIRMYVYSIVCYETLTQYTIVNLLLHTDTYAYICTRG